MVFTRVVAGYHISPIVFLNIHILSLKISIDNMKNVYFNITQ